MRFTRLRILVICLPVLFATTLQAQTNLPQLSPELAKQFTTTDTLFKAPYVDVDEWRNEPVRHRYVHGGFKGTENRFSFYFPPKVQYQGRFFQYFTPFPDSENLANNAIGVDNMIECSVKSGAYFIETNSGGKLDFSKPRSTSDPTIAAYRANAASAQYSRLIAAQLYGGKRPYGYAYGGSGGAYRAIGSLENTKGVWDGVIPLVMGSPVAIPNVFTARMHAMRILKDKLPGIADAVEPGSKVDMYAGLNPEEKQALEEVTKLGFPPKAWFAYNTMGIHGFIALYQGMVGADNKYFTNDFWNVPGYLGANPPSSLLKARIQQASTIKAVITEGPAVQMGLIAPLVASERGTADAATKSLVEKDAGIPVAFQLENRLPDIQFLGGDLIIKTGIAAGKTLQLAKIAGDKVVFGPADKAVLASIKVGDTVQVDNSNFLAAQTYHRHQVPGKEYAVWDQYRDAAGKPIYPQRPFLLGPSFTKGASGVLPNGKFSGKMIVLESLWDSEAFPWQADWYRTKVKENLGTSLDDNFRLWYTDHGNHGDFSNLEAPTHVITLQGILIQALQDLSAWVEKGVSPPASTSYTITDGQVIVPPAATKRLGIQPVVTLLANGSERAEVEPNQAVTFTATIEVPPNTGKVIAAEWDFDGVGTFPIKEKLNPTNRLEGRLKLRTTHTFNKPGTYFVTLKGISQRQGDSTNPYTRIPNLGRVRVVVK